jgi:hypothetical protein
MQLSRRLPGTHPRRPELAENALDSGALGEQGVDGVDQVLDVAARQPVADGRLPPSRAREFERQRLGVREHCVETVLEGRFEDQSALYGMLRQLESLGLELVDMHHVGRSDG